MSAPLLRFRAAALVALSALGCGVDFDPASKVSTLRVLAVQKDKPYARPGDSVTLQLLWHDPSFALGAEPAPEIAWLASCENPPGDFGCGDGMTGDDGNVMPVQDGTK